MTPLPAELGERYNRLIAGLLSFQQPDGLWSTVMDRPDFYREISGSAGIGYGVWKAHEVGLLTGNKAEDDEASERALQAVLRHITEDGVVEGVSGGTPVMESIEAYNRIPIYPAQYGQGLVLMLLSEALLRKGAPHE